MRTEITLVFEVLEKLGEVVVEHFGVSKSDAFRRFLRWTNPLRGPIPFQSRALDIPTKHALR